MKSFAPMYLFCSLLCNWLLILQFSCLSCDEGSIIDCFKPKDSSSILVFEISFSDSKRYNLITYSKLSD